MRVWLLQTGEPMPFAKNTTRMYRTGLLASELHRRGHEVVFWGGTFDHAAKCHTHTSSCSVASADGYQIRLLHGRFYKRNVSWQRLVNHLQVSRAFEREAMSAPPPDVILNSMPTIELCRSVARFARGKNIPVIVDIRDLWPDIFMLGRGRAFRACSTFPLWILNRWLRTALGEADSLVAVSEGYMDWALAKAGRQKRNTDQVYHLGYEPELFERGPNTEGITWLEQLRLPQNAFVCWFLGNFGETYDVDTVIEAARALFSERNSHIYIVISGHGHAEHKLRERAVGIPNVIFTGWIDRQKLAAMMQRADVGLAAYGAKAPQGLPNKLGEYACGGLAIVSSLRGEGAALLDQYQCGLSYSAANKSDLAGALRLLAGEPERLQQARKNARRLFCEQFDGRSIYPAYAAHLEKITLKRESHNIGNKL